MDYSHVIDLVSRVVDVTGVVVIVFGVIFSLTEFCMNFLHLEKRGLYSLLKQRIGKVIIIGLEILIAGDIIRSIAVPPSFTNVGILALIILIRVFLSIQIENENNWHFPWQKGKPKENQ